MSRRLLLVAGGGASFTPPPAPEVATITAAPNGGWTQASSPKAVLYAGWLYVGYVDSSGNIEVVARNAGVTGSAITLHAALEVDTHAAPSLWVRSSDHKLIAVYSSHFDTTMRMRVSTTSLDTDPDLSDGFAAEVSLDAQLNSAVYVYPIIFEAVGVMWLVWRDTSGTTTFLVISTSSDGGVTWSSGQTIFSRATFRPYWFLWTNGSRVDLVTTDGAPADGEQPVSVYHAYFDTVWRASDGTAIGSPPFDQTDLTLVRSGASVDGWAHTGGYLSGEPVTVINTMDLTDTDYVYARWNGSAWVLTAIDTTAGIVTAVLDPANPERVYAPIKVGSFHELHRFDSADAGATWSETAVTSGSAVDNLYPAMVHDGDGLVLWLDGTFTDPLNFSLGIKAYGVSP